MNTEIPVIYTAVTDPKAAKLANDDGAPVGEVTGTSDELPIKEQLEMIREMLPDAEKIGILYTTSEVNSVSAIEKYEELAGDYGFTIVKKGVTQTADISLATEEILSEVDCLSILTDITVVDLNLNTYEDCNVLCLINPKDNFSPYEIAQLEKFLSKCGRLFIALNHAIGLLDHPNNGYINSTGVEDMLEKKGLKIRNDLIIDNNCGVCNFEQQYGYLKFQRSVSFPY